jgi:transposase
MAGLAHGLSALVHGVELLPAVAQRRHLAAHPYGLARTTAGAAGTRADSQRGHYRQSIGAHQPKRGRRGYDGGKKVKGRKRHLLVETTGLILQVLVHEADIQDEQGGKLLLAGLGEIFPRLQLIWADSRYKYAGFPAWVQAVLGWTVEIVAHPHSGQRGAWRAPGQSQEPPRPPRGFHLLPRRWVVERTFAWLSTWRRLSKDYELLPESEAAWIYLAMIRTMLRRLASDTS